jgi:acetyl esterase
MPTSFPDQLRRRARRQLGDLFGRFIKGTSELGAAAWAALPQAQPERHGVHRTIDVAYREGGDPAHLLDVYRPIAASESLRPCVLYIHGGSFRILSKDSHFMMGIEFARAGYVVFNINYRLAPAHPFPAAVEDVADAYRWVVSEARRWGADPDRLVVAGESAGANLALDLAIMTSYERPEPAARRLYALGVVPKAVVPLCGILQVSDPARARGRVVPFLVQDRIDALALSYFGSQDTSARAERALADPLLILEAGRSTRPFPPTFASVGARDALEEDTVRLERALKRNGVDCEARIYPGEGHAFQALTFRAAVRRQWDDLFAFLGRHIAV